MNFDIKSIIDDLKIGAIDAARSVAVSMLHEAAKDAADFITVALPSIERYVILWLTKQISEAEFKSLMIGLFELAEMKGLTEAGLAEMEVDRTRNAILKTVTTIVIGAASKAL
jgi:hypothetical protein